MIRKIAGVFGAAAVFCASAGAVECMGPSDAANFAVYLHDEDSVTPGARELQNRAILSRLSSKLKIRFAFPRATGRCSQKNTIFCWAGKDARAEDLKANLNQIKAAADICFKGKNYGIIGFANGGLFVNSLKRDCLGGDALYLVSVEGTNPSSTIKSPKSLKSCRPPIKIIANSANRQVLTGAKIFYDQIARLGAEAEFVEYHTEYDDHGFPDRLLGETLQGLIQ